MSEEPLWTLSECCEYLNCTRNTVRRLVGRGEIPYGRLGPSGHLRFDPTLIRDWFQGHGVAPEQAAESRIRDPFAHRAQILLRLMAARPEARRGP